MGHRYSIVHSDIQKVKSDIPSLLNPYSCYSCSESSSNISSSLCNGRPIICKKCEKTWCRRCGVLIGRCSTGGRCKLYTTNIYDNIVPICALSTDGTCRLYTINVYGNIVPV